MRAVLQRVARAEVTVDGNQVAAIGPGILALIGISQTDTRQDLEWMARKIVAIRIFDDAEGKLNLSLLDTGGQLLLVSQFTLYGECRKGRRPSYSDAAPPSRAADLYAAFVEIVRRILPDAQTGQFQAMMKVSLLNDGPVTLIVDTQAAGAADGKDVSRG
jgi:D-aminoacyl-tRNA deacylase